MKKPVAFPGLNCSANPIIQPYANRTYWPNIETVSSRCGMSPHKRRTSTLHCSFLLSVETVLINKASELASEWEFIEIDGPGRVVGNGGPRGWSMVGDLMTSDLLQRVPYR